MPRGKGKFAPGGHIVPSFISPTTPTSSAFNVSTPDSTSTECASPSTIRSAYNKRIIRGVDSCTFLINVYGMESHFVRVPHHGKSVTIFKSDLLAYRKSIRGNSLHPTSTIFKYVERITAQLDPVAQDRYGGRFHLPTGQSRKDTITYSLHQSGGWDLTGAFIQVCEKPPLPIDFVPFGYPVPVKEIIEVLETPEGIRRESSFLNHEASDESVDTIQLPVDEKQLTIKEQGAAENISSMLSSSIRNYASGVAIYGTDVTLYYGDRFGLVISEPFDLIEEPHQFILAIAAITNAHSTALGFAPFLRIPKSIHGGVAIDGLKIKLQFLWDEEGSSSGPHQFVVDRDNGRNPVWLPRSPVGRATTVVPVRFSGPEEHTSRETRLVLKYCWSRVANNDGVECVEGDILSLATQSLKRHHQHDALKHIPKMIGYFNGTTADANLPRIFLGEVEGHSPRLYTGIIMHAYEPVSSLSEVSDFKKIFTDILTGHHWLWEYGDVLQGDISKNNVMFYRTHREAVGVLCDFDFARFRVDVEREVAKEKQVRRRILAGEQIEIPHYDKVAGTTLFLSCELLSGNHVPVQTYRHDLEALYNFLVVFCATHNPKTQSCSLFAPWASKDVLTVGKAKCDFLERPRSEIVERFFKNAHPQYLDLVEDWVLPLRNLFAWSSENFSASEQDELPRLPSSEEFSFRLVMEVIGKSVDCDCGGEDDEDDEDDEEEDDDDEEEDDDDEEEDDDDEEEDDDDEEEDDDDEEEGIPSHSAARMEESGSDPEDDDDQESDYDSEEDNEEDDEEDAASDSDEEEVDSDTGVFQVDGFVLALVLASSGVDGYSVNSEIVPP
ncbi:hypothetical protein BXZ70DRAFT_599215 [Cristinia sonorae]|uniref:Fungal-type protein kinase domain-containing protein n=1 Tax=Cristinia sonorae TaxID=1940300 RepID=A0A8K0UUM0_9AGAR|nr:hypothetical protein BXZ70DRAFT_599215 [Cristinia sonorae]